MSVRVLSFHAGYGCRHRGRCCSSGWPIAVEGTERTRLERAIESGVLTVARPGFQGRDDAEPTLLASVNGRCVFHDDHAQGGCRIHRAMGHGALPLACRQFPRQSVRDPRGVSVTLSHYCPTANDLLVQFPDPTVIVENAPAFPAEAEYVGLAADHGLPPLLHQRLAMDWESWWLFEEMSVSLLSEAPEPLARLGMAVEYARRWTVAKGPLADHLREAFTFARSASVPVTQLPASRVDERTQDVLDAVPGDWREHAMNSISTTATGHRFSRADFEAPSRRFLAAHAFANWAAYQGEGLRTWFRAVETAAALLARTDDPGTTDLLLRHLADPAALIDRWKAAEREPAVPASG